MKIFWIIFSVWLLAVLNNVNWDISAIDHSVGAMIIAILFFPVLAGLWLIVVIVSSLVHRLFTK
ncbi:MAG: hypothetical protein KAJ49_03825 [Arcobacteraceae bacterium]|nr:hypothetical protein [Arcobacteraceae bacterium]